MGCGVYWQQIKELNRALGTMRKYGIPETADAYRQLAGTRYDLLGKMGVKLPRSIIQISKLVGFSPGSITLWFDVECGWMTEGRIRPGAPPVYKSASDEIAMAILKREITDELEEIIMTPDPYLGE